MLDSFFSAVEQVLKSTILEDCPRYNSLALPSIKKSFLHYTKLLSKQFEFPFCKWLSQDINDLLICWNVLRNHSSLLNPVYDEWYLMPICMDQS